MAKQIVWTLSAIQDRLSIYTYWQTNNGSDLYSKKLEILFNKTASVIAEFPEIGKKTKKEGVRAKIVKDYILFYSEKI